MILCVTTTYGGGHCSSSVDFFSPRKSSIRTKRLALVGSGIFATHGSPQNHMLYLVLDFILIHTYLYVYIYIFTYIYPPVKSRWYNSPIVVGRLQLQKQQTVAGFTYLGVFTSLKALDPRKKTHLQTPLAGYRGKEKSQSKAEFFVAHFGLVLVDEWFLVYTVRFYVWYELGHWGHCVIWRHTRLHSFLLNLAFTFLVWRHMNF